MLVEALPSTADLTEAGKDLRIDTRRIINAFIIKLLENEYFKRSVGFTTFFEKNSNHHVALFENRGNWIRVIFDAGETTENAHLQVQQRKNHSTKPDKSADVICKPTHSSVTFTNGSSPPVDNEEAVKQTMLLLKEI